MKRSFGRSSRQKLIDELQFWNGALRACFEKSEVPLATDAPSRALQGIQSSFNAQSCNATREQARQIYVAVAQSWACQSHDHRGNLKLSWHTDKLLLKPGALSVAISSVDHHANPAEPESESWQEVAFEVIETPTDATGAIQPIPSISFSTIPVVSVTPKSPDALLHPRKRVKAWFDPQSSKDVEMKDALSRTPSEKISF